MSGIYSLLGSSSNYPDFSDFLPGIESLDFPQESFPIDELPQEDNYQNNVSYNGSFQNNITNPFMVSAVGQNILQNSFPNPQFTPNHQNSFLNPVFFQNNQNPFPNFINSQNILQNSYPNPQFTPNSQNSFPNPVFTQINPQYPISNPEITQKRKRKKITNKPKVAVDPKIDQMKNEIKIQNRKLKIKQLELKIFKKSKNNEDDIESLRNTMIKLQNAENQALQTNLKQKIAEKWKELEERDTLRTNKGTFLGDKYFKIKEHRFSDIKCPSHSAILINDHSLCANKVVMNGNSKSKIRFNSNLNLVSSQAPMKSTEPLFWQAIFDDYYFIVDLTTPNDVLRGSIPYYPTVKEQTYEIGPFKIQLTDEDGMIKTYRVENTETKEVKTIKRIHCKTWVDCSAGSLDTLIDLVKKMNDLGNTFWIHCLGGIGRSGTLITAALLYEKIKKEEVSKEALFDLIPYIINKIRKERGPNTVQKLEQFEILFSYGYHLIDQKALGDQS